MRLEIDVDVGLSRIEGECVEGFSLLSGDERQAALRNYAKHLLGGRAIVQGVEVRDD
jgi:hypothetical protein